MKSTNLKLEDDLNKEILLLAKEVGMTKEEWMAFALGKYVEQVRQRETRNFIGRDYLADPVTAGETIIVNALQLDKVDDLEAGKVTHHEGAFRPDQKEMKPVDGNGVPSMPTYVFFMKDGSEQKQVAKNEKEAQKELGIADHEYLDWTKR